MVNVQLGTIQSGAWSDNVGVFSGQNIQNSWDSHSSDTSAFNGLDGDWNYSSCVVAYTSSRSIYGQPMYDSDAKGNYSNLTNA